MAMLNNQMVTFLLLKHDQSKQNMYSRPKDQDMSRGIGLETTKNCLFKPIEPQILKYSSMKKTPVLVVLQISSTLW